MQFSALPRAIELKLRFLCVKTVHPLACTIQQQWALFLTPVPYLNPQSGTLDPKSGTIPFFPSNHSILEALNPVIIRGVRYSTTAQRPFPRAWILWAALAALTRGGSLLHPPKEAGLLLQWQPSFKFDLYKNKNQVLLVKIGIDVQDVTLG